MKNKKDFSEKIVTGFIIVAIIISAFAIFYTVKSLFFQSKSNLDISSGDSKIGERIGRMSLTSFDIQLAKKFMDKNNDGKCDSCGMPVDMCISSGQLQCNMDSKSTIGVLDTTKEKDHHHADFKVYIDGKEPDFNQEKYFVKSKFIHIENDIQGDSGKALHMHASGVPLWIFFESIGMKFEKDCFTLDNNEKYCNDNKKTLRFYVNGNENNEFGDYVFKDNDKILIIYGNKNEDISGQLNSITDFAKNH